MEKLILWDIDGTLLKLNLSKLENHSKAFETIYGIKYHLDFDTSGMTDTQIFLVILQKNKLICTPKILQALHEQLNALTLFNLTANPSILNPSIEGTLEETVKLGWVNGLLTGNTRTRSTIKLQNTSIFKKIDFTYGYFGDIAVNRFTLLDNCLKELQQFKNYKILLVGDTPLDILTAQSKNLPIVALATGKFQVSDLKIFKPALLLADLDDGFQSFFDFLKTL
jgi:phosphoglycolate phosphatase-like HAD superfamily hydrolase